MTKEELDFILKDNSYLENGTKQACVKIQDYLKNIKSIESIESKSSIDCKDFLDAINVLLAFSFREKDTIPERWYCECDCRYNGCMICPGEFNTDEKSEKICPYYKQENI